MSTCNLGAEFVLGSCRFRRFRPLPAENSGEAMLADGPDGSSVHSGAQFRISDAAPLPRRWGRGDQCQLPSGL